MLSSEILENIVKRTLRELENGRAQIFEFAEAARKECVRTERVLQGIQLEIQKVIDDIEKLTMRFDRSREKLYEVNKNFAAYNEAEKAKIYEEASKVREDLATKAEKKRVLKIRYDELEQALLKFTDIAEKAELIVSQLSAALNYLSDDMSDIGDQIETLQARELVGQQIIKSKELERKKMAGLLHDGPVQDLANLAIQLEICEKLYEAGQHNEAIEMFVELKGIVQVSLGDLRRTIYDLNPMTLDDLGLFVTVKNYLLNLTNRTGTKTKFNLLGKEVRLDSSLEMTLFRTIQELVQNSFKHAKASVIRVVVEYSPNFVLIEVKDDGVGFELAKVNQKIRSGNHYGILSIQSRLNLFNGTLSIKSKPGEGTKVLAKIPLDNVKRRSKNEGN